MKYIRFFNQLDINSIPTVGGKNASLGEMFVNLQALGVKVPNGFATTSEAYWLFISQNNLKEKISKTLEGLDISNINNLNEKGFNVRNFILEANLPTILQQEIITAYRKLSREYNSDSIDVAVRSSGTAEDLIDASFAGQQESFLNINSEEKLLDAVKKCFASLFTNRAISYRESRGYDHLKVALSVGIQKMVRSDESSSGVMFTIDTQSGSENLMTINSIYGLGENIVSGKVTPDEFAVFKPMLKKDIPCILKREMGNKTMKMVYCKEENTKNIDTSKEEFESFSLTDDEVIKLATYGLKIEEHYSTIAKEYRPMDIEWAKDANDGELYIIQARPETVHSKKFKEKKKNILKEYKFVKEPNKKDILVSGTAIGEKIGCGKVRVIEDLSKAHEFKEGEVLVTNTTDPDWEPLMKKAVAVVTNKGGRTCHAAILAREIGVPTIVGSGDATKVLEDGMSVTLSCAQGEEGFVYSGSLDFEIKKTNFENIKETKTKLMMNIADPQKAFLFAQLPNAGVGLARMEFIINHYIKCHPMALVSLYNGKKIKDEEKLKDFIKGYENTKSFFVKKLAEGIATIAAAFYPKPVIVRTSDFKSNEYKSMLGGFDFELDEENPMIGFRGASRYYSSRYKEAFLWECEALKMVRDEMGLTNVKVMIPFVRTPTEGSKVIEIMNEAKLIQGKNGLEIYAMCEIPSNVIFADEFLKLFDGYSIGSNDLTQLMLGVDRDSELISHIFDERNEAVRRVLKMAIDACKKEKKYIGICGQAPSDYPEITEFLVKNGIDSISLNPDSVLKMWKVVEKFEC